jgi:ABC-type branched-subunit amino acid transport system ATPase component
MGAGRSELLLHLIGLWGQRRAGSVKLDGQPLACRSPREALRAGLALVTEDRKRYGLVLQQGAAFNLTLSSLARLRRGPFIDEEREGAAARSAVAELHIKTQTLDSPVATLSGGNQQKVVLGKALMATPKVLLLDEPTRGIDVGAKLEVYELINRLTAEGKAIVLVSSELGELLGMSDRIVMLHAGCIGGSFARGDATQEKLLAAAMAGSGRRPDMRRIAARDSSLLLALAAIWAFFAWREAGVMSERNFAAVDRARGHRDAGAGHAAGAAAGADRPLRRQRRGPHRRRSRGAGVRARRAGAAGAGDPRWPRAWLSRMARSWRSSACPRSSSRWAACWYSAACTGSRSRIAPCRSSRAAARICGMRC